MSLPSPRLSPRLPLLGGLCAAALLSFPRALAAGTLRVDEDGLPLWGWALFFVLFGAAAAVAARLAALPEFKGKTIVVVLPDAGERYLSTVLFQGIGE